MPDRPTLIAVLAFLAGLALSPVSLLGIQSQERQLALLAKERAEISRMDWVGRRAGEVDGLRKGGTSWEASEILQGSRARLPLYET
jgi:hypothetical protein